MNLNPFSWVGYWLRSIKMSDRKQDLQDRARKLAGDRQDLYTQIDALSEQENDLISKGRGLKSPVQKRRLATEIKSIRDQNNLLQAEVRMKSQMITFINAHIHNLTMASSKAIVADLPDAKEITDGMVDARQVMEEIDDSMSMITDESSQVGAAMSKEELDIMKELGYDEREKEDVSSNNPAVVDENVPEEIQEPLPQGEGIAQATVSGEHEAP